MILRKEKKKRKLSSNKDKQDQTIEDPDKYLAYKIKKKSNTARNDQEKKTISTLGSNSIQNEKQTKHKLINEVKRKKVCSEELIVKKSTGVFVPISAKSVTYQCGSNLQEKNNLNIKKIEINIKSKKPEKQKSNVRDVSGVKVIIPKKFNIEIEDFNASSNGNLTLYILYNN